MIVFIKNPFSKTKGIGKDYGGKKRDYKNYFGGLKTGATSCLFERSASMTSGIPRKLQCLKNKF